MPVTRTLRFAPNAGSFVLGAEAAPSRETHRSRVHDGNSTANVVRPPPAAAGLAYVEGQRGRTVQVIASQKRPLRVAPYEQQAVETNGTD